LLRCDDFSIFQDGVRAILIFKFLKILTVGRLRSVELRRLDKFGRNRINCGRDMVIFPFFQDGGDRYVGFLEFEILTVGRLKRAELRRRAKFGRNPSNCNRDMAIFRYFQDGGRPLSWICYVCVRTTHEGHLVIFIAEQNLVESMQ